LPAQVHTLGSSMFAAAVWNGEGMHILYVLYYLLFVEIQKIDAIYSDGMYSSTVRTTTNNLNSTLNVPIDTQNNNTIAGNDD
jgi:hypothetical protein